MTTKGLLIIVLLLGIGWWLASNNPTSQAYENFQDQLLREAVQRVESSQQEKSKTIIKQLMNSKNSLFFKSLIRSQTIRRNFGLFSLFETKIVSSRFIVLGIGGTFYPLSDPEEAIKNFERTVISPSRSPR